MIVRDRNPVLACRRHAWEKPVKLDLILAVLVVVLGASGTYLLLPHRHVSGLPRKVHAVGAGLGGLALLLFALLWTPPGPWISGLFFYLCGLVAVGAAVAMVVVRNPIHSALWFAAVVLATTGLFVLAGAQFLAVGTVIVYAGAIIVTFLFVIMLAQMEGRATYDRAARMPFRATWTCFVLFLGVLWALLHAGAGAEGNAPALVRARDLIKPQASRRSGVDLVAASAGRPTAQLADEHGVVKPHVASLGETLYTDHLVTVELAGALLFVALVGAVAIATPRAPVRPGGPRPGDAAAAGSIKT
jgi:NADH-quinone oxidoreductase subunit J